MELGNEELGKLQMLEQKLQVILTQKQNFQAQLLEVQNAIEELKEEKEKVYRIVGNIMIESNAENLNKDLKSRKEILDMRLKSIEKQEDALKKEAEGLQKNILSGLNDGK